MKNPIALLCLATTCMCYGQQSPVPTQPTSEQTPPVRNDANLSPTTAQEVTERVFREVNAYRKDRNLSPLIRHAGLDQLAKDHCKYLVAKRGSFFIDGKNVSHFGHEARSLLAQYNYKAGSTSENVACTGYRGAGTAAHLVEMWSASKSHDMAMRDTWTHTGVGVTVDKDGAVFCTQFFADIPALDVVASVEP